MRWLNALFRRELTPLPDGRIAAVCQQRVSAEPLHLRRPPAFPRAGLYGFIRVRS